MSCRDFFPRPEKSWHYGCYLDWIRLDQPTSVIHLTTKFRDRAAGVEPIQVVPTSFTPSLFTAVHPSPVTYQP